MVTAIQYQKIDRQYKQQKKLKIEKRNLNRTFRRANRKKNSKKIEKMRQKTI